MFGFILFAGIVWLLLTLFEPLVAYIDAGKACDQKYAFDRFKRAQSYEEMAASHRASPLYQQMKEEKQLSKRQLKRKEAKARRAQLKKEQKNAGQSTEAKGNSSSPKTAGQPHGKKVQKKKSEIKEIRYDLALTSSNGNHGMVFVYPNSVSDQGLTGKTAGRSRLPAVDGSV